MVEDEPTRAAPVRPTRRSDTGPFAIIPEWVLTAAIPSNAVRIYGILARFADNATGECWPSRRTLSDSAGCSLTSVDRSLHELEEIGALEIHPQWRDDGSQRSNLYTVRRAIPVRGVPGNGEGGVTAGGEGPSPETGSQELDPVQLDPGELDLAPVPAQKAKTPARRADPLWDAVMDVCGIEGDEITDSARKSYNGAVAQLRKLKVPPEVVYQRAEVYRMRWPEASLTPQAFVKHWAECQPNAAHLPSAPVDPNVAAIMRLRQREGRA